MPVIQVEFNVSEEMARMLASGNAVRYGGVIRDTAGQIIEHLDEVSGSGKIVADVVKPDPPIAAFSARVVKAAKNNKYLFIGLGVAAAAGIGIVYYNHKKNRNKRVFAADTLESTQDYANDFNDSVRAYYTALMTGNMSRTVIASLRSRIELLMDAINSNVITIDFDNSNLKTIASVLDNYGDELKKINGLELTKHEDLNSLNSKQLVECIIRKLKEQEKVFIDLSDENDEERLLAITLA